MPLTRRNALTRGAALFAAAWSAPQIAFAAESPSVAALDKSDLIYLSPIVSDGKDSACHGEVWFVHHDREIFVVTQSNAWRAEATRRGFNLSLIHI